MIYRRLAIALSLLFVIAVPAFAATARQFKTLQGTWTCPTCDLKHFKGTQAECEAFNHNHALKLNDGTYVTFLESPQSKALIAGGGRHDTPLEVSGLYDSKTHVLDVDAYMIDGVWSTWCEKDQRMDLCRAGRDAGAKDQAYTSAQ